MTAPGDFTSGAVLTAADMNDLPAGHLDTAAVTSAVSLSTSATTVTQITFTLPVQRRVLMMAMLPSITSPSQSARVSVSLTDYAAGGTGLTYNIATSFYNSTQDGGSVNLTRVTNMGAGTHTVYMLSQVSAGTATAQTSSRVIQLSAYDMGEPV